MSHFRTDKYELLIPELKKERRDLAFYEDNEIIRILLQEKISEILKESKDLKRKAEPTGKEENHNASLTQQEKHFLSGYENPSKHSPFFPPFKMLTI